MLLKKLKVYYYFWFVAFLILTLGLLGENKFGDTFNLNDGDTYYVISQREFIMLLSFCYFTLGIGYWFVQEVLKRKLIKYLTLIHCVILFGSLVVFWLVYFYSIATENKSFPLIDNFELINQTLFILFLLIVFIGQPIYFINVLIALIKKRSAIRE